MSNLGNIFGGYANQSWSFMKEGNFGDCDSFLFNLNKDCRLIPSKVKKPDSLVNQWKRYDGMGWGATD